MMEYDELSMTADLEAFAVAFIDTVSTHPVAALLVLLIVIVLVEMVANWLKRVGSWLKRG